MKNLIMITLTLLLIGMGAVCAHPVHAPVQQNNFTGGGGG